MLTNGCNTNLCSRGTKLRRVNNRRFSDNCVNCNRSIKSFSDSSGFKFDKSNITKFNSLLKFVNSDEKCELQTLYAAQLLAEELKHPIGKKDSRFINNDFLSNMFSSQWISVVLRPVDHNVAKQVTSGRGFIPHRKLNQSVNQSINKSIYQFNQSFNHLIS